MAMQTHLLAIADQALQAVRANPESFPSIESDLRCGTYLNMTLSYFLAGVDPMLSEVVDGCDAIECSALECAYFHVLPAARVKELAIMLVALDKSELRESVLEADLEEIEDGEVWEEIELANLLDPDEVANEVEQDLEGLTDFYRRAAASSLAVVLYTS